MKEPNEETSPGQHQEDQMREPIDARNTRQPTPGPTAQASPNIRTECTKGPPAQSVNDCAAIVAAEYNYWRNAANDRDDLGILPTAALANVLCALNGFRAPWHPFPVAPVPEYSPVAAAYGKLTQEFCDMRALFFKANHALAMFGRHHNTCPLHDWAIYPGDERCTCGLSKVAKDIDPGTRFVEPREPEEPRCMRCGRTGPGVKWATRTCCEDCATSPTGEPKCLHCGKTGPDCQIHEGVCEDCAT